jgi:hypothetical protein
MQHLSATSAKGVLWDLATLNVKLLVDYSGVIRSKTQSKERIQLNERSVDLENVAWAPLGS